MNIVETSLNASTASFSVSATCDIGYYNPSGVAPAATVSTCATGGNANIPKVIKTLSLYSYEGNYILQTARAKKDHVGALSKYQQKLIQWLKEESPDATRP